MQFYSTYDLHFLAGNNLISLVSRITMTNPNQSELEKLRAIQYTLEEEIGELHHELRQVWDGLERVGGVSRELDQKARQIQISIRLCEKELKISLDKEAALKTR